MKSIREYFKFYNSFKGRINRKTYILILLKETFVLLLYTGGFFISATAVEHIESKVVIAPFLIIMGIMFFVISIVIAVSQITSLVKRLHDLNFSGYWVLLIFFLEIVLSLILELSEISGIQLPLLVEIIVSIMAVILFLVGFIGLFFIKGTKGDNKYGPDPLQEGNLNIPKLSKSALMLLVGLPVIFLFSSLSMFVIKKGFKGGLEEIQKVMGEMQTEMEEREIRKEKQGEFLKKKLEGVLGGDAEDSMEEGAEDSVKENMEESTDTEQAE